MTQECDVVEAHEGRRKYDDLKLIGIVGTLLAIILGWIWKELEDLGHEKADLAMVQSALSDRWTKGQQEEYRRTVEAQMTAISRELERIERSPVRCR